MKFFFSVFLLSSVTCYNPIHDALTNRFSRIDQAHHEGEDVHKRQTRSDSQGAIHDAYSKLFSQFEKRTPTVDDEVIEHLFGDYFG
ncbi:Oidioi.mRNA.OKI2018_I69.chr2.g4781.t1.cds [Oikopleura dioica]|uniref:Oidioi.mRNA.OKI2018_I69.chr2.g4781.t1.cds n=1 Tax=Oikopleura dioica TaxID=34765 RepID=A0ABN7T418_OIKDI|nr:Oidioi.mRNA.OKI2018_I69.chr2.g4781.t1.cds [Oikopleura dioica]